MSKYGLKVFRITGFVRGARIRIRFPLVGLVVAAVVAPISASAGHASRAACSSASPQRSGGISEMVACGNSGVRGNRAEFVSAISRPVVKPAFLSQLAH
jgi:hypothetical protein